MNNDQFKPLAYAAKTQLNQSGFDIRSGHIHEIIAALLGYQSKAAFLADTARPSKSETGKPLVTLLDMQRATDRVTTLLPRIGGRKSPRAEDDKAKKDAAYFISRDISKCVEAAGTAEHIFLGPMGLSCENAALKVYAKSIALAEPIMAGVVDDPMVRYRNALEQGFSKEMADLQARHLGPLKFPFGSCGVTNDRLFIDLSDEYSTINDEHGVVRVYLEGRSIAHRAYVIDHSRTEFTEGEYFDDIPEFDSFSNGI